MPCTQNEDGTLDVSNLTAKEQKLLRDQQMRLSMCPYYSAFGYIVPAAGGNFTVKAGTEVKAFAYPLGQDAIVAGLPATTLPGVATLVETNLQESGKTISGQAVHVRGITIQPFPNADAFLVKKLMENISVALSFAGGNNTYQMGPLHHLAGGSGLFGASFASSLGADFNGNPRMVSAQTNGFPVVDNFFQIREGFTWWDEGADSQMNVIVTVRRDIIIPQPLGIAAVAENQPNLIPVQAFVPPEEIRAIFSIRLVGEITAPRSMIS